MGMKNWQEVVERLTQDKTHVTEFHTVFKGEITPLRIQTAIAEYQKSLITPGSRFDRYLKGSKYTISKQAQRGFELFKSYGCIACHEGVNVGGTRYDKLGIKKSAVLLDGTSTDLGRFEVTKNPKDKHVFKVPSLRLVAYTPPYFHDGSVRTLKEAVSIMMEYQIGKNAPEQDLKDITSFLKSLHGKMTKGTM